MLNNTATPATVLDGRDDINTVALIPNDTSRLDSNKLEPYRPKKPSPPDLALATTTPNPIT